MTTLERFALVAALVCAFCSGLLIGEDIGSHQAQPIALTYNVDSLAWRPTPWEAAQGRRMRYGVCAP